MTQEAPQVVRHRARVRVAVTTVARHRRLAHQRQVPRDAWVDRADRRRGAVEDDDLCDRAGSEIAGDLSNLDVRMVASVTAAKIPEANCNG